MATKRLPRPRDPLKLAKLIGDIATGQVEDHLVEDGKDQKAAAKGRKGGPRRAATLPPRKRAEIAQTAAQARWKKSKS